MFNFGISIFLFTELFCAPVNLKWDQLPWTENDAKLMYNVATRCYYTNRENPCLKSINKSQREDTGFHYHVICGAVE